jgi:hypothetical protein
LLQAVTTQQQQQPYAEQVVDVNSTPQQQWQQQQQQQQQQQADPWQQQQGSNEMPQQPPPQQQQQQRRPRSPDQQLSHAIKHIPSYPLLAALVRMRLDEFQPHHTATALLRLAQLVHDSKAWALRGGMPPLNPAVDSGRGYDSYDGYDQDISLDAPHLHGLSSGTSGGSSVSSSSSSSSTEETATGSSDPGSAGGYGYISGSWQQLQQQQVQELSGSPYRSSRVRGLSGLLPSMVVEGVEGQQQLPPLRHSSSNSTAAELEAGLLSGATMAARMAAVRQQRAEQAALVRGRTLLPWQQRQQLQQQAAQQWEQQRQQQPEVCYDALLSQLLERVVQQSGGMSASSGLNVLSALNLLKLQHRCASKQGFWGVCCYKWIQFQLQLLGT